MYNKFGKRAIDIVVAVISLVVLLIPMTVIALMIRLESRGPALFRQLRYGKNKHPFAVYKFRTMSIEAPDDIPTNSFKHADSYITRLGAVLRKLSIDELPQFINVLFGDMSLVGPRPVVLTEKVLIEERDKHNACSVKPGITGWAQVNGRDELDDFTKAEMDGEYVKNINFVTDVKCMLKTAWAIISAAGHSEGHEQTNRKDKQALSPESR